MDLFPTSSLPLTLPVFCFVFLIYVVVVRWFRRNPGGLPYPPGPTADPLVGNLRQLPKKSPWLTYAAWKKIYGDIISVEAFGKRIVVVNSAKVAFELFDKRGSIYSERPHNVMIQDLMQVRSIALLRYTPTLRAQRRLLNSAMNLSMVKDYTHIQEREAYALLGRILDNPEKFYHDTRRMSGAVIMSIAYGHTVESDDDHYVKLAEDTVQLFRGALQPTSFLVNIIPVLKYIPTWMPFTRFHQYATKGRAQVNEMIERPFEMVKSRMLKGDAPHSYTSKLLEANLSKAIDDEDLFNIKSTAAALYGAGADTTLSAIITFILAMVLHPDVQRKAQAELDAVIGSSRLPTLSDKESLPYLNWVLSEVLRWHPSSVMGVPHALRQDDVYEGYFIPGGAMVLGNIWAMTHDEEMYKDPNRFWPERFDGRFPGIKDPRSVVFGFGRRLCPGRHLAINSVFITMACLLATFNMSKKRDAEGKEVEPLMDFSLGPPKPFDCQMTVRNKETQSLIKATIAAYEL